MITVRILWDDGYYSYTKINATPEEAKSYYEGNYFNVGTVRDEIKKCIRIDILEE